MQLDLIGWAMTQKERRLAIKDGESFRTKEQFKKGCSALFNTLVDGQFVVATVLVDDHLHVMGRDIERAAEILEVIPRLDRLVVLTKEDLDAFIDQAEDVKLHDLDHFLG